MKRRKIKYLLSFAILVTVILFAVLWVKQKYKRLVLVNVETGEIYADKIVEAGDELSFEWEHSFEHVAWNEFYEIDKSGIFLLHSISVGGYGAGIPAEMECTYRYEDGLIYMEGIESQFEQFRWINSQTALKQITLNGKTLVSGTDMPHHKKMELLIR